MNVAVLFLQLAAMACADSCRCGNGGCPPSHVWIDCVLMANISACYVTGNGGHAFNYCDSRSDCLVYAGERLQISCNTSDIDDELILYRDDVAQGQGGVLTVPFANSSLSGEYECRWRHNDSVNVRRFVVVEGECSVSVSML